MRLFVNKKTFSIVLLLCAAFSLFAQDSDDSFFMDDNVLFSGDDAFFSDDDMFSGEDDMFSDSMI